ncbi:MAG: hypothetical protein MZV65_21150 [Chromatiales bacterium]|nr:hypothetical protein [Chromatiales bacterium]
MEYKKEEEAPAKKFEMLPEITWDDFGKIDLRVAKVLEAEAVPKSNKLIEAQDRLRRGAHHRGGHPPGLQARGDGGPHRSSLSSTSSPRSSWASRAAGCCWPPTPRRAAWPSWGSTRTGPRSAKVR